MSACPPPDERLREVLAALPDLCRAIVAAVERAQRKGGDEVRVLLRVGPDGLQSGEAPEVFRRKT
jgi:hypothetical protein